MRRLVSLALLAAASPALAQSYDVSSGATRAGLREGTWRFWQTLDGPPPTREPVARGRYEHGRKHGHWTYWYWAGRKQSEIDCRGGLPHGRYRTWHDDGTPWLVGQYDHGRMTGEWREYQRGGAPAIGRYKNGHRIWGDPIDLCEADSCSEGDSGLFACMPFGDDGESWE